MEDILVPASPPVSTLTCRCGRTTYKATSILSNDGDVSACWLAIGDRGEATPGCRPDERYDEVCARRLLPKSINRGTKYPGATMVRCSCGRTTRVITSNVNSIDAAPDPAPLDQRAPVKATSCWLAIGESSLIAGCTPDERTFDILARRGLLKRAVRELDELPIDATPTPIARTPATFRRLLTPPTLTAKNDELLDDLTSADTAIQAEAPTKASRSEPPVARAKRAATSAPKETMLSLFG